MHLVQILMRFLLKRARSAPSFGKDAHWRLGYFRERLVGLYLPRRSTRVPIIIDVFPQSGHERAIFSYHLSLITNNLSLDKSSMDFLIDQDIGAIVFRVLILVFSVVIHEVSHGAVAYVLGDPTAKDAGRLTLNPLPHIDFIGSIVLPIFIGIGWAKPVPYNPLYLRNQRWGPFLVGVAGPASNIVVALFFGLMIRFRDIATLSFLDATFFGIATGIVFLNLALAIFNMIPIPPLDGSKVLFLLLPRGWMYVVALLEQYGILLILFLFLLVPHFFSSIIIRPVMLLFGLITGSGFY